MSEPSSATVPLTTLSAWVSFSTKGKSPLQVIGAIVKHTGLWSGVQGMIKNGLGRPAVYALDSLLTGDNVGLWHLTIGIYDSYRLYLDEYRQTF